MRALCWTLRRVNLLLFAVYSLSSLVSKLQNSWMLSVLSTAIVLPLGVLSKTNTRNGASAI